MDKKQLKVAISPCPNDTYIFGPWINKFIDTDEALEIRTDYLDIQELNEQALNNTYDIIKISAAHIPSVIDNYAILACGGALTEKTGPLLIAKKDIPSDDITQSRILLPGINTTAAFLFGFLFPKAKKIDFVLFSEIEDRLLNMEADAGVIIHESRFTYETKGLKKIFDLGELWFDKTKCPIPLGVIAINRQLDAQLKSRIQEQIKKSILWANHNADEIMPFIQSKATEMDLNTIAQHIHLYVNEYSINLGGSGKIAIMKLCNFINRGKLNANEVFI